jgi:chromosome partitioning protein
MKQIIISLIANAGGVGKTTLATHLAWALNQEKISVALVDLDPQHSLDVFCGCTPTALERSTIEVLSKEWKGDWHLQNIWNSKIDLCQSHPKLDNLADDLVIRKRGEYTLKDRLKKYPLPHQIIILDCPATFGKLCENAIAASTHLLIPLQLESKAIAGLNDLIQKIYLLSDELQLEPIPKILGLAPSKFDKNFAIHRDYLEELPVIEEQLKIKIYPPIRESAEFKNACAEGKPLGQYRPGHKANRDFQPIVRDIIQCLNDRP